MLHKTFAHAQKVAHARILSRKRDYSSAYAKTLAHAQMVTFIRKYFRS